jgi:hypothetical protein
MVLAKSFRAYRFYIRPNILTHFVTAESGNAHGGM